MIGNIIGISDGSLWPTFKEQTYRYLDQYTQLYSLPVLNGVELVWLHKDWWDVLTERIQGVYLDKQYISLHLSRPLVQSFEHVEDIIGLLYAAVEQFRVRNIVVHADWACEWVWLRGLDDLPISIENTDHLSMFGKTLDDVESVVGDFHITLDLQHCFDNDRSGNLALDFHNRFLNRIAEFHVSGWGGGGEGGSGEGGELGKHVPLSSIHQRTPLDSLTQNTILSEIFNDPTIPVIIESECGSVGDYESEVQFVVNYMNIVTKHTSG